MIPPVPLPVIPRPGPAQAANIRLRETAATGKMPTTMPTAASAKLPQALEVTAIRSCTDTLRIYNSAEG
jgi:hypothetical protein